MCNDCDFGEWMLKAVLVVVMFISPIIVFDAASMALTPSYLLYEQGLTTVNVPAIKFVSQLAMTLLLSLVSYFFHKTKYETAILYSIVVVFFAIGIVCFCNVPSIVPGVIIGNCNLVVMQLAYVVLLEYHSDYKTVLGQLYALALTLFFAISNYTTYYEVWLAYIKDEYYYFVENPKYKRTYLILYCIFGVFSITTKFWFSWLINNAEEKKQQKNSRYQKKTDLEYEPENNVKFMFMQLFSVFLVSISEALPDSSGSWDVLVQPGFPIVFVCIFALSLPTLSLFEYRGAVTTIYTVISVVFSMISIGILASPGDLRVCSLIGTIETALYFGTFDMDTVHGHAAYCTYLVAQQIVSYIISTRNVDFLAYQTYFDTYSSYTIFDARVLLCVFLAILAVQCVFYVAVQCCYTEREDIMIYIMLGVCVVGTLVSGIILGVMLKNKPAAPESDTVAAQDYHLLQQMLAQAHEYEYLGALKKPPELIPGYPNPSTDQVALRFELRLAYTYSALVVCGLFTIVCAFDAIDNACEKNKSFKARNSSRHDSRATVITQYGSKILASSTK